MMKKIALIFLCLLLINVPVSVFAAEPKVAAHGAVLMEAGTGRVLWGKNEHEPLPVASTTKIMTAILTLESGRLNETVTVSAKAAAAPKVKMYLTKNEKIRLGDLLLALMLESSNDAAVAIAEHIGGSMEAFCEQMTEKARQLGARDTVFLTPNGLDAGQRNSQDGRWHHSTAYDLALITKYALTVPGFAELTNTQAASFSSDKRAYHMNNRNRLLREYTGANGVKTGFTNQAGHCFVGAAKREEMQLISVVLASGWGERGKAQKWKDTKAVLNYGFGNYEYETILTVGDVAGALPVTRSRSSSVEYAYADGLRLPLNRHERDTLKIEYDVPDSIPAPVSQGEKLGMATVYINGEWYEIPLTALDDIKRHDLKTSMEKILDAWLQQGIARPVKVVLPELG
jgi:D-alanyl-D-alanine carboxypeptidase (penicillin-binding protein 5/6)